jgi:hypothetical protein
MPIGPAVDGADRNDRKPVAATRAGIAVERPRPTPAAPQNLSPDKGYAYDAVRQTVAGWGSTARIRARGEERAAKREVPGYRARRRVVERAHPRMDRFRRVLIRWEKKADNYLAMLHFACAIITFRAAGYHPAGVVG